MRLFRTLAVAGALLAFLIAILGSWIRINGAGMTCPDWPLCHGQVVPALHGGVVLEWSHRAMVGLETAIVLGTFAAGWRLRARLPGAGPVLLVIGALFVVQVLLGAATVRLANSPASVVLHWAAGMGLLAAYAVLAVVTTPHARERIPATGASAGLAAAAALAFVTMGLGAYVSSSNAGLACPTLPGCGASAFGTSPAQLAQMLHRSVAAAFVLVALVAAFAAAQTASRRTVAFAVAGIVFTGCQVALGAVNVGLGMPTLLRELHAANAAATFVLFIVASATCALDGARQRVLAADAPRRVSTTAAQRT